MPGPPPASVDELQRLLARGVGGHAVRGRHMPVDDPRLAAHGAGFALSVLSRPAAARAASSWHLSSSISEPIRRPFPCIRR